MNAKDYKQNVLGACRNCGGERAPDSKSYCLDCLRKQADSKYIKYHTMDPEVKKELLRKQGVLIKRLREERKAAGLCINCGRPSRPGKGMCTPCAEHVNRARRERRRAKKYEHAGI